MRITIRTCWAVLTLALLAPVGQATAQTFDEIARTAAERRKTADAKPDPPKVYTNDDLKPASAPPSAAPATPTPAPAATSQADKPAEAQKAPAEEKGEEYWRTRMAQARENLRRNELFREALQTRVNSLSNDFAARDDPGQRAQIASDRQTAVAELARVNAEIEQTKKKITEAEEEARQAGVPPGWLR